MIFGGGKNETWDKKIWLEDYVIEDSKIEKTTVQVNIPDSNGKIKTVDKVIPGKVLAIRYKKIIKTYTIEGEDGKIHERYEFEKNVDKDGNQTMFDAEYYSYTGSKILIDQAENDFSREDLPAPTVIQQFAGKKGQTFFKFT